MKDLVMLSFQQIRRRPSQSSILFASIVLASLLLASGLGLLFALHKPFDQVFEQLNGSHALLYFDQRRDDPEQIQDWFRKQEEVSSVSQINSFHLQNGPFILKDKKLELSLRLVEYRRKEHDPDSLHILSVSDFTQPDFGQIWINRSFAATHDIQLGDSLGIPIGPSVMWLEVGALVVDPHYASGMVNPSQAWLAAGALVSMYPINDLQEVMLGVRVKEARILSELWDRFIDEVGYEGSKLDHHLFRSASGSLLGLIGNMLLLVALLSFLLALLLIRNSLQANIQADYRQIGIWKSLGFLPREIRSCYLIQVLLISLLGIALGLLGAKILLPLILQQSTSNLGITQIENSALPFLLSPALTFLVIFILTWISSRKAAEVPAAQAIRRGRAENEQQYHFFSFDKMRSPSAYFSAFLLQSQVVRNVMLLFSFALCVALTSIILSLGNSFSRLEDQPAAWGFEEVDLILKKSDQVLISRKQHEILELLKKEEEIQKVIPYDWVSMSIPPQKNGTGRELMGKVYVGKLEDTGLTNLQGRHPQNANEISLCIGTARQYGILPGDFLMVEMEGEKISMQVSGIYQDIGNMGQGFRIHISSIRALNPLFEVSLYGLQLFEKTQKENLKHQILQRYGEIFEFERSIGDIIRDMGIVSAIWTLVQMLSLFFFLIIALLNGFDLGLLLREERGHFALLKSLGMRQSECRNVLLYRIAFILLPAIVLGQLMGNSLGAMLISQISAGLGLPSFPYQINLFHHLLLSLGIMGMVLLLTYWKAEKLSAQLS